MDKNTCETCKWFKSLKEIYGLIDSIEHICVHSNRFTFGAYGQDGKSIMVTKDFGCIKWENVNV